MRANDSMARNDDWKRVSAVGSSNCPNCLRLADSGCNVGVATSLAIWHRRDRVPHSALERCATQVEVDIEGFALACEVRAQLFNWLLEHLAVVDDLGLANDSPDPGLDRQARMPGKDDGHQSGRRAIQRQRTDWRTNLSARDSRTCIPEPATFSDHGQIVISLAWTTWQAT
jgi:hypothetical protein